MHRYSYKSDKQQIRLCIKASIAVIADDLTGAADTGAQFSEQSGSIFVTSFGLRNKLPCNIPLDAVSISTATRHLPPVKASVVISWIANALKSCRIDNFYKKIDSGLRGNIGVEVDTLLDTLDMRASFIAPAFPSMGRTTQNGVQLIYGIPVNQTEIGNDPRNPVSEANIPRLIASQSRYKIGFIPLFEIEAGTEGLVRRVSVLLSQGVRHIVFDSTSQEHLDLIASIARYEFKEILPVGSSGLAIGLANTLSLQKVPDTLPIPERFERILFVCGSSTSILKIQTKRLISHYQLPSFELKAKHLIHPMKRSTIYNHCQDLAKEWQSGFVLTLDPLEGGNSDIAPDKVISGMAKWAAALIDVKPPGTIFLSGGDTAEAVLRQLEASGIWIYGQKPEGVIHGRVFGGDYQDMAAVTKAGSFGPPDLLLQIFRSVKD